MKAPSPSNRYKEEVWAKVAERYPSFTHAHDPFDDPWAVDCLVLGESIGYVPKAGERVMDIGANVGIWTAFCALGGCRVAAYEADPITFGVLTEMLRHTGLLDRVTAVNAAIFSRAGECEFKGESRPTAGGPELRNGAVQVLGKNIVADGKEAAVIRCLYLADALGNSEWDFVKMDIEGAEFQTLLVTPLESLRQIKAMQIEFHNTWADREEYNRVLDKLGEVFTFEGPTEQDESLPYFGRLHWAQFKRK